MFRDGIARLLVFRLGGERFAVPLVSVDEVVEVPAAQGLPDAPRNVLGLATIRGELVPIYDPRPTLCVGDALDGAALLFARGDRRVALPIDDVYDAITIEVSAVRAAPVTDASDGVVVGVVRHGGYLVALLDPEALLDAVTMATGGEGR